jgi:sodium pump decarboxylase gamma subunit
MLIEGLTTMATGMATVFSFLIILWFAVSMMGKIVAYLNKIFPEKVETAKAAVKQVTADVEVAIAIAAAKTGK